MRKRTILANSWHLMSDPDIIFCDEPTSALDFNMRIEVLKLLREINETMGTTIVIVSHDISVIQTMCHRAAILENGTISDIVDIDRKEIEVISYKEALV